jgi:hypothetical protein
MFNALHSRRKKIRLNAIVLTLVGHFLAAKSTSK